MKAGNRYIVNLIRSQRATEREGLEPRTLESNKGDFDTLEEAQEVYNNLSIGMEVDKELVLLEVNDDMHVVYEEIIETTY